MNNSTIEETGQKRGELTQRIKDKSKELLGYEMNLTELRFMPYVHYCMINEQKLDPNKINADERKIWAKWKNAGHVDGGMRGMAITKEFWNILNEIIFLAYVDTF